MKIRIDYVTNSSSSSFILAIHKDFSNEELNELIENNRTIIKKIAEHCMLTEEEAIDEIEYNFGKTPDLVIDNWNLFCGIAGNEYGGFYNRFLDRINAEDTEHFKMRYGDD